MLNILFQWVYEYVNVVLECNDPSSSRKLLHNGAGLPLHKANRFYNIVIGRYWYHKNTIINNGFLSLVGIAVGFAGRVCSSHCGNNAISYIEASRVLLMRTHISPSTIVTATCAASYILNDCA